MHVLVFWPPWPFITQLLVLTGIHYGLPLAAPLAELLGVLLLYLCSFDETGHDVIAGLERLFGSVHCVFIIARLGGYREGKMVMVCNYNRHVALKHMLTSPITNTQVLFRISKLFQWAFLRFDRKYNPHHPEAFVVGIL